MHYWEIRKYDNGTFIVSESDADGSTPDYKRKYSGGSISKAWRCFRHCVIGITCSVKDCERKNCKEGLKCISMR